LLVDLHGARREPAARDRRCLSRILPSQLTHAQALLSWWRGAVDWDGHALDSS